MSSLWLIPLAVTAVGAAGLAVVARKLQDEVDRLGRSVRRVRTERDRPAPAASANGARRNGQPPLHSPQC
jgi:hypothetical protein